MSQKISLASIELAPLASAHDLVGINDRGGLIEALVERVAHEGARRGMVAAHARVDVSNELATVGDGDAPLQDARRGALVQLVVNYGE
jgi:hypothetical protein